MANIFNISKTLKQVLILRELERLNLFEKNNKVTLDFQGRLESQITECYRQILEREPDKEGLTYYSNQLRQDKITIKDFERILTNSKEYSILNYSKQILMKYKLFIKKPIFIIGVPRTGTTLLYNILCGHEKLAWFSNEDIKNWLTDFEQFSIKQYAKCAASKAA